MRDAQGKIVTHEVKCRECNGRGERPVPHPPGSGKTVVRPCPSCKQTGRVVVPVRRRKARPDKYRPADVAMLGGGPSL